MPFHQKIGKFFSPTPRAGDIGEALQSSLAGDQEPLQGLYGRARRGGSLTGLFGGGATIENRINSYIQGYQETTERLQKMQQDRNLQKQGFMPKGVQINPFALDERFGGGEGDLRLQGGTFGGGRFKVAPDPEQKRDDFIALEEAINAVDENGIPLLTEEQKMRFRAQQSGGSSGFGFGGDMLGMMNFMSGNKGGGASLDEQLGGGQPTETTPFDVDEFIQQPSQFKHPLRYDDISQSVSIAGENMQEIMSEIGNYDSPQIRAWLADVLDSDEPSDSLAQEMIDMRNALRSGEASAVLK